MSGRRLLLVDDDPSLAAIVRVLARRAGHSVAWAADAASATAELRRERPDLVLLDINLPGVSGPQWLRGIRDDEGAGAVRGRVRAIGPG